jgi:hypothetical protein
VLFNIPYTRSLSCPHLRRRRSCSCRSLTTQCSSHLARRRRALPLLAFFPQCPQHPTSLLRTGRPRSSPWLFSWRNQIRGSVALQTIIPGCLLARLLPAKIAWAWWLWRRTRNWRRWSRYIGVGRLRNSVASKPGRSVCIRSRRAGR